MRVCLLLAACFFSHAAVADLFTAQNAYHKGDYERAFRDYRELAELGQPIAQYNLAFLYLKGLGVPQSDLNAYAWATLAAANGSAPAKGLADTLRPTLPPGSEEAAARITAPYSQGVLDERLMPKVDEQASESLRCKAKKTMLPRPENYPGEAKQKGVNGHVFVVFTVMPDGSSRNPRIFYAVPSRLFDRAVRADILHLHSEVDTAAAPADCRVAYDFKMDHAGDPPRLPGIARDLKRRADEGDTQAAFDYGLLAAAFQNQLHTSPGDAVPFFVKAAQTGSPVAQYVLGTSLLFGWGCRCDVSKAEVWLRSAAAADEPSAQVTLAARALHGEPDAQHVQMAATWLARASASGDAEGRFYYAALLAAAPDEALRDPKRALKLLDQAEDDFGDDPTAREIRAAALAATGDYRGAVKSEEKAIAQTRDLQWDLGPLNERLALYQSGHPWSGYLLAF
jgi:TPR repeat protein